MSPIPLMRHADRFFSNSVPAWGGCRSLNCLGTPAWAQQPAADGVFSHGTLTAPHFPPTAKRIIYLHMLGAISQVDTFDYKPTLEKMHGQELPESVRGNRRLSSMVAGQTSFPIVGAAGQVSAWRQERSDDQRPDAVHARGRGRPLRHQDDEYRACQPRSGVEVSSHGISDRRTSVRQAPG